MSGDGRVLLTLIASLMLSWLKLGESVVKKSCTYVLKYHNLTFLFKAKINTCTDSHGGILFVTPGVVVALL